MGIEIFQLIIGIEVAIVGAIVVIGILLKWSIFTDTDGWIYRRSSGIILKDTPFEKFIPVFNALIGVFMIIGGLIVTVKALSSL